MLIYLHACEEAEAIAAGMGKVLKQARKKARAGGASGTRPSPSILTGRNQMTLTWAVAAERATGIEPA